MERVTKLRWDDRGGTAKAAGDEEARVAYGTTAGIVVSVVGNLAVGVGKLAAALLTGSAAMMTEAVHSFVDASNAMLIVVGQRTSRRPPDEEHPLGYGMDLYFWTLVVALVVFVLGVGFSVLHGVDRLLHPQPVREAGRAYLVLGLAALFDGGLWVHAWRKFRADDKSGRKRRGLLRALRRSKDPRNFISLFEDSASLIGIAVAAAGIASGRPEGDALAAIAVGAIMGVAALLLAHEARKLLLGERADHDLVAELRRMAEAQPGVRSAAVRTVHFGPDRVLAEVALRFREGTLPDDAARAVQHLDSDVRRDHPQVRLVLDPQGFRSLRGAG